MYYFSIFSKNLTNHGLIFSRLDEKHNLLETCEEILKIFDEDSTEKLNFYFIFNFIFRTFVTKIDPSEITSFFYNGFFGFGGIFHLSPPAYALAYSINLIRYNFWLFSCFWTIWSKTLSDFKKFRNCLQFHIGFSVKVLKIFKLHCPLSSLYIQKTNGANPASDAIAS